jgi:hypothetical protein
MLKHGNLRTGVMSGSSWTAVRASFEANTSSVAWNSGESSAAVV